MPKASQHALILLAAGRGSRFGSDKRQHRLASGVSLLATTLALYQEHFAPIVVVLRPGDEALGERLQASKIVYAPDAALGMGHSLASGASCLLTMVSQASEPFAAGGVATVTVALAEMPYVQPSTVQQLHQCSATLEAPFIVQPSFNGRPGNPVLFSADYLPAFTQLNGDKGARAILNDKPEALHLIEVKDPGVVQDIDQPQDIQA